MFQCVISEFFYMPVYMYLSKMNRDSVGVKYIDDGNRSTNKISYKQYLYKVNC